MRLSTFALLASLVVEGCTCASECTECLDASLDARRRGADAGTDAGVDAFVQVDAATDAWEPDATGTESCAPGRGRTPFDEDRDGRIDEGCPFYIGPIHPVLAAMPVDDDVLGGVRYTAADITNGATRLFTTPVVDGSSRSEILVFRRASAREPFQAQTRINLGEAASAVSATEDGTLLFVEIGNAVRTRVLHWSGDALTPMMAFEAFGEPYVRRDGREVFLSREGSIYASVRDADGAWTTPKLVTIGRYPSLSDDGRTLYYTDAGALHARQRVSLDATFDASSERPEFARLDRALLVRPFHVPRTRELFFSLQTSSGLDVPTLGPTRAALFRAEVCRDAPCIAQSLPCTGTRSADGLHCYVGAGVTSYEDATAQCPAGHLVSIHSAAELRLLSNAFPNAWLGAYGRRWASGEPFLYALTTVPSETCLVPAGTTWRAEPCSSLHQVVCETDLWPVFTD